MRKFTHDDKNFLMDGKPFQIRSGAIHYFRMPNEFWYDRLLKLKECGFNTVETYIAWNFHERVEGEFVLDGDADFVRFLTIAKDLGLYAIVRPGPFICAEWDGGGLPGWLVNYNVDVRCNDAVFLEKTERYLEKVFTLLTPLLYENGGNILMFQIENEYGSYGNDKQYLGNLEKIFKKYVPNGVFFTSDGVDSLSISSGRIHDNITCGNFGSNSEKIMSDLGEICPNQPLMCGEFWCGWFDHWMERHHTRSAENLADEIDVFMKHKYSFNLYMFFGGTNFGFFNGANCTDGEYQPTITSYDYDAPLNEYGVRTKKYYAVRDAIKKYIDVPELTATDSIPKGYGEVRIDGYTTLLESVEKIGTHNKLAKSINMEKVGVYSGFVLYDTKIEETKEFNLLRLKDLHDRAVVMIDGTIVATRQRAVDESDIVLEDKNKVSRLSVLVENMGRINFGMNMFDTKGVDSIIHHHLKLFDVDNIALPMDNLEKLEFKSLPTELKNTPAFFKGKFLVDEIGDTFIKPEGFNRGFIVVNGYNIGRFDMKAGPQKTLFIPSVYLKKGENSVVIFDGEKPTQLKVTLTETHEL